MASNPDTAPVVVVTGGTGGIGRACVREFARAGYRVAVLARGRAGLDAAAGEVVRQSPHVRNRIVAPEREFKSILAIARAVVNRPKLILADEPTGNVDDAIALRLMTLFVELHKIGSSVIIATHNHHLVERFGFPRLHLEDGVLTRMPPVGA